MAEQTRTWTWATVCAVVVTGLAVGFGCSKQKQGEQADVTPPAGEAAETGGMAQAQGGAATGVQYCDFTGGPADAKVKVEAYYPGRHEDTLAAVKSLLETFPGKVKVEIVDWRREEGLKRRDAAGLVCAGVMINDKNAFEVEVDGKTNKVLFVRGLDGEWTKADLEAAVRKELALAK